MDLFNTALRTPGSEVRNELMQQKLDMPAEDYVEPVTPEDQAYQLHVVANAIALNTLRELGPSNGGISEKMFQRAKREMLPVDSVRRMLEGLATGRATQAKERYEAALLKAVKEAVEIEKPTFATPEELTNDAYVRYMLSQSEEDLEMSKRGVSLPAFGREVDDSANRFGQRSSDYGAGTGDYALFNPARQLKGKEVKWLD